MAEADPVEQVPGQIESDEESPKKSGDLKQNAIKATGAVEETASRLTDGALSIMGRGISRLDDKVPQDTCCSRCLKRCRGFEDPVQLRRCSCGRLGFALLALVALALCIWEVLQGAGSSAASAATGGDSSYSLNLVELLSNVYVLLLALFCAIVLGGDIFMFDQFVAVVNNLQVQVTQFSRQNDALEEKLEGLGHVEQGLQSVYNQMGGDIEATTNLLLELDRFGKLQTVGAVVNQFFAADLDGSGYIGGMEAEFLIPQLTLLWDLVPSFDQARFVSQVNANGLRLPELASILDHMVNNDSKSCLQALEAFCSELPVDEEGNPLTNKLIAGEGVHQSAFPACLSPACLADCDEDADIESNRRPPIIKAYSAVLAMAPPGDARELKKKDEGPVLLAPMFSIPSPPCCRTVKCFGFTLGSKCSIWGWWHLIALCHVPVSVFFLIFCIIGMEIPNIILATVGLCLTLGLVGTGKLIEVLRALRSLLKQLKVENKRLEASVENLGDKVEKLAQLQHGFEKLQQHCEGNCEQARDLISKSNTKVKMEAMAVITHLFRNAGLNSEHKLVGDSATKFLNNLGLVFKQVPGFDLSAIQNEIGSDQIGLNEVKQIVDIISSFGKEEEPAPGAGETE